MSETDIERYNRLQRRQMARALQLGLGVIGGGIILLNNIISILRGHQPVSALLWNVVWLGALIALAPVMLEWLGKRSATASNIIQPDTTEAGGSDDILMVTPSQGRREHAKVKRLDILIAAIACVIPAIMLFAGAAMHDESRIFAGVLWLFLPFGIIGMIHANRKEDKMKNALAARAPGTGLTLQPDGLTCSISLVWGACADALMRAGNPVAQFHWGAFQFMSVEPLDESRGGHPAYYKFVLKKEHPIPDYATALPTDWVDGVPKSYDALYVLREPLYGHEQDIIGYIKSHAGIPIEMKDDMR